MNIDPKINLMMKSRLTVFALLVLGIFISASCSKGEGPKPDTSKARTFKVVITRDETFISSEPIFTLSISGVDDNGIPMKYSANFSDPGNDNIYLTEDDLISHKTITITSIKPVVTTQISLGCSAGKLAAPTHLNIEFYYDNKKVGEEQINVTSEDYVKLWTFDAK